MNNLFSVGFENFGPKILKSIKNFWSKYYKGVVTGLVIVSCLVFSIFSFNYSTADDYKNSLVSGTVAEKFRSADGAKNWLSIKTEKNFTKVLVTETDYQKAVVNQNMSAHDLNNVSLATILFIVFMILSIIATLIYLIAVVITIFD